MNLLLKIKRRFFEKNLKTALPVHPTTRKITSLEQAKSVGILFDATDATERQTILDYASRLAQLGKKVRLLGFVNLPEKKVPTDLPFVHFHRKTVNWFGRVLPNDKADAFCKEKFDLLLCLFSGENRPLEWLTARSSAKMKAGSPLFHFKSLDFTVETPAEQGIKNRISQLEFYFKRLVVAEKTPQLVLQD